MLHSTIPWRSQVSGGVRSRSLLDEGARHGAGACQTRGSGRLSPGASEQQELGYSDRPVAVGVELGRVARVAARRAEGRRDGQHVRLADDPVVVEVGVAGVTVAV